MSATVYLEGAAQGPDSKDQQVRCREGFRKLLEKCGYERRLPRLVACGSRNAAFHDFKIAHGKSTTEDFVALWIDSEDPLADLEQTWKHLEQRGDWPRPSGSMDKQILLMTTCMETWIVADHAVLEAHYAKNFQKSALPPLTNLEQRQRHEIQKALIHATRNCSNAYSKGDRSFLILAKLNPETLKAHLPSFARIVRILDQQLAP